MILVFLNFIKRRGKCHRKWHNMWNCHKHCCLVVKSCSTLCSPIVCSLLGSFVHGILQIKIMEWVAICYSRGSSWPRDQPASPVLVHRFFTSEPSGKSCHKHILCQVSFVKEKKKVKAPKRVTSGNIFLDSMTLNYQCLSKFGQIIGVVLKMIFSHHLWNWWLKYT